MCAYIRFLTELEAGRGEGHASRTDTEVKFRVGAVDDRFTTLFTDVSVLHA